MLPSSDCVPLTAEHLLALEKTMEIQLPGHHWQDRRVTALLSHTLLLCRAAHLAEATQVVRARPGSL